jgi:hypothetical protein
MPFGKVCPWWSMPFSEACPSVKYALTGSLYVKNLTVTERHWRTSSIPNFTQIDQQICTILVEISLQLSAKYHSLIRLSRKVNLDGQILLKENLIENFTNIWERLIGWDLVTDGQMLSPHKTLSSYFVEKTPKTAIISLNINTLPLVMRKQLSSVHFELQLETFALSLRKNINITTFCAYWLIRCQFRAF